jgi:hypothetical protein
MPRVTMKGRPTSILPRCSGVDMCNAGRRLTIEEEFLLSPAAKWKKYGIFPLSLLTHMVLAAVALAHVVAFNGVHGVTSRVLGQVRR